MGQAQIVDVLKRQCPGFAEMRKLESLRRTGEWGIANWIFLRFQRTWVTRVTGFWHNPRLQNDQDRTPKCTCRSHPDR
jgi:hypothetical protein